MADNRQGRMRVILTIHGGEQALADVMEGLVERNVRSIHTRVVPPNLAEAPKVVPSQFPVWRDAVTALADGVASRGTIAAWQAANERVRGNPAHIALVGGIPQVVYVDPKSGGVSIAGLGGGAGAHATGPGVMGKYAPDTGKVDEHMLLTIDDDYALPVRAVNTAIARHNARQIKRYGLPRLYKSGVRYETEGSPELWWDAQEILRNGHDDCFAAETVFLTREGPRRLGDVAGTRQTVLTREGAWVPADIVSGRVQQLFALTLTRSGETRVEFPTREHKWFVFGTDGKTPTDALVPGDQLLAQRGPSWTVVSMVATDRIEEVFCAVVPGSGSFTLAGDLVTSNCEGLAAYRAGELIALENKDATVWTRFISAPPSKGGGRIFHAITRVAVPDSSKVGGVRYEYDDPSVRTGMATPSWYLQWCAKMRAEGKEL